VEFTVLIIFAIIALVLRALFRSINTVNSSKSSAKTAARRRQLQDLAQRMRAGAQQSSPGFPQPPNATYRREVGGPGYQAAPTAQPGSTAPFSQPPSSQSPATASVAPPPPPFTAAWPGGAPPQRPDAAPPVRAHADPVVVEVAVDPAPASAYPTDEPTGSDSDPDVTTAPPPRRRYELSSSLDTTLSTSLTSSVIGEQGSIAAGPQTVPLPPALREQVLELMDKGHEVAAVRLVCDEMDAGILEAQKTVRNLAGLPTVM
jgi:hypothetical protein